MENNKNKSLPIIIARIAAFIVLTGTSVLISTGNALGISVLLIAASWYIGVSLYSTNPIYVFLSVAASMAINVIAFGFRFSALIILSVLPFSSLMSGVFKSKYGRRMSLAFSAGFTAALYILAFVGEVYISCHEVSVNAFRSVYGDLFTQIESQIISMSEITINGQNGFLISQTDAVAYVNFVFYLMPAMIYVTFYFMASFVSWLAKKSVYKYDVKCYNVSTDIVTLIFFVICFICSLAFSGVTYLCIAFLSLFLLLMPHFIIDGIEKVFDPVEIDGIMRRRILPIVIIVIALLINIGLVPIILFGYSAVDCLKKTIASAKGEDGK